MDKGILQLIANTIRGLSIDAIQKANSGHPGLPLGCAEIGAYLYAYALNHNPKNPEWPNRDRFILSAGHGSMMLYSCLHLAGFDLSLDDIKNFRKLHSKTPGHPEYSNYGIETTTGPLGQGFANGVGQALGLKMLKINDSKVFILAGDGCIMEGISSEVSSLAGHLKLDNLIIIYDANDISLDGPLSQSCSENVKKRYEAYGWKTFEIDGHNFDGIDQAITKARTNQKKPCLIIAKTIIGKGSPKSGSNKAHGSPLNKEEVAITKKFFKIPEKEFYVPKEVYQFFNEKLIVDAKKGFEKKIPSIPENLEEELQKIEIPDNIATRQSSHFVLQKLAELIPTFCGGSADLSSSDQTFLDDYDFVHPGKFDGRNIKYGVREFGMGAMTTGLAQAGLIPFCGTFLVFSDYMKNAIRMAAMQEVQVIYQFTHDSFLLGEDGPTHQPIEQLAALRAIPNLQVIRPADNNEVKMAWFAALKHKGPTAIVLSRQKLPELPCTKLPYTEGLGKGAYIVKDQESPDYTIFATGSELKLALDVASELEKKGKGARVISMPCWEIFDKQDQEYKDQLLKNSSKKISIEAASSLGWHKYIGQDGITIDMTTFGASAPKDDLSKEFGFTVENILDIITANHSYVL